MSCRPRAVAALAAVLALAILIPACGPGPAAAPGAEGENAISRTEGQAIPGAEGWRWVPFPDSTCTDVVADPAWGSVSDP